MENVKLSLQTGKKVLSELGVLGKGAKKSKGVTEHRVNIGEHWTGVKVKESEATVVDGVEVMRKDYNFTPQNQLLRERYHSPESQTTIENNYAIHETGFRIKDQEKITVGDDVVLQRDYDHSSGRLNHVMEYNPETKSKYEMNYRTHETGIRIKGSESIEQNGVELLHRDYDSSTGKIDYYMKYNPATKRRVERNWFTHETGYRLLGEYKVTEDDIVTRLKKYEKLRGKIALDMVYDPVTDIRVRYCYELHPTSGINLLRRRIITKDNEVLMNEVYPFYGEDPSKIKWLDPKSLYYDKTAVAAKRPLGKSMTELYQEYKTYAKAAWEDLKDLYRQTFGKS